MSEPLLLGVLNLVAPLFCPVLPCVRHCQVSCTSDICVSLAECSMGLVGRSDGGREPEYVDSPRSHAPGRTVNPSLVNWNQFGVAH
jgi:hypothetical protein